MKSDIELCPFSPFSSFQYQNKAELQVQILSASDFLSRSYGPKWYMTHFEASSNGDIMEQWIILLLGFVPSFRDP